MHAFKRSVRQFRSAGAIGALRIDGQRKRLSRELPPCMLEPFFYHYKKGGEKTM
jgi:hypothetical protein